MVSMCFQRVRTFTPMISKAQIKHLVSLHQKKFRVKNGSFLVQGEKMVHELLGSTWIYKKIYCMEEKIPGLIDQFGVDVTKIVPVDQAALGKIGTLSTPNAMLAEVEVQLVPLPNLSSGLHLMLDGVKDPGNLGTILRIADQFGVASILCTDDCVDLYNPKVVQSTMGSLFRVPIHYNKGAEILKAAQSAKLPVHATLLEGENIYKSELPKDMLLILGSESHGVREEHLKFADHQLTIPNHGNTESLNVAVAAAVFCSEYRARSYRD